MTKNGLVLANDSKQASFTVPSQQVHRYLNELADTFATLRAQATQPVSGKNPFLTTNGSFKSAPTLVSNPDGNFKFEPGQSFTGILLGSNNLPRVAALVDYNG